MAWVRIDTGFTRNRKMLALTDRQRWAHVAAMCWVAENGTDGFIPKTALGVISEGCSRAARALVRVGVWEEVDGGFVIHDWAEYNITKEEAERRRQATRERVAKFRERQKNGKSNAVTNASGNGAVTRTDTTRHDSLLRRESRGVVQTPPVGGLTIPDEKPPTAPRADDLTPVRAWAGGIQLPDFMRGGAA